MTAKQARRLRKGDVVILKRKDEFGVRKKSIVEYVSYNPLTMERFIYTVDGWGAYNKHMDVVQNSHTNRRAKMTDSERARINAICDVAHVNDIGDLSDGFHTFNDLYYQRCVLFASIVRQNKSNAWKSFKHEDGELCFGGGWFIVGVDTPEGSYTYHYENKYWDLFDCDELPTGKHWDGHTDKNVTRLLSLPSIETPNETEWIHREDMDFKDKNGCVHVHGMCEKCGLIHDFIDNHTGQYRYCPQCGGKIVGWRSSTDEN